MIRSIAIRYAAFALCVLAAGCQTEPKDELIVSIGPDGKMTVASSGKSAGDKEMAALLQSALNGELDDDAKDTAPALTEDEVWRKDAAGNITHIQSGATCPQTWGDYRRTKVSIFRPDGMDVGCNYETGGQRFMTFYVYKSELSLAEELKGTMETVKARQPISKDVPFAMPSANGSYVAATLAYDLANGTQMRTSSLLAKGGTWRLKIRLTTPAKEATDAERLASIAIIGQSERLNNPQAPVATNPPI
jgi:hypothetical protein